MQIFTQAAQMAISDLRSKQMPESYDLNHLLDEFERLQPSLESQEDLISNIGLDIRRAIHELEKEDSKTIRFDSPIADQMEKESDEFFDNYADKSESDFAVFSETYREKIALLERQIEKYEKFLEYIKEASDALEQKDKI